MYRRLLVNAIAAAVIGEVATITAALLYLTLVLGERLSVSVISASVFFGWGVGLRGCVLTVPAALLFSFRPARMSRPLSVAVTSIAAGCLGIVLSYWTFNPFFHVSREYAAVLLSLTWAAGGLLLATAENRSPNAD